LEIPDARDSPIMRSGVMEGQAPEPCLSSQLLCLLRKNNFLRCGKMVTISRKENTICKNKNLFFF
jgi:hypothetical protein